ncbi:MAG: response regulator transcription factor [Lachnoclostridium sp.]|jgi:DNA-binding response OmpR family regulator|nr:response regulator transcription factor [Lachnoclostridium sp.]
MARILIIEEEKSIAELEKDYLELSHFDVSIESNGAKGLEAAKSGEYDLVIMELILQEVDGYEICKQIRQNMEIPIIVISRRKEDIDKIRVLGLGADDYITKPFSPSEMVARVKAHLIRFERLTKVNKNEVLYIDDIRIDKTARRVYVKGEEVFFTSREFDLLSFLATNPNRVYSKEELFKEIWGVSSIGENATVTVHIKKIREKIETNSSKPEYIETVWGIGYRFKIYSTN